MTIGVEHESLCRQETCSCSCFRALNRAWNACYARYARFNHYRSLPDVRKNILFINLKNTQPLKLREHWHTPKRMAIVRWRLQPLAWENSRHLATLPQVSPPNDETSGSVAKCRPFSQTTTITRILLVCCFLLQIKAIVSYIFEGLNDKLK